MFGVVDQRGVRNVGKRVLGRSAEHVALSTKTLVRWKVARILLDTYDVESGDIGTGIGIQIGRIVMGRTTLAYMTRH